MVRIELTAADADVLRDVLEDYLSDLRMEIADTDSQEYREGLKVRKEILGKIIDQIASVDLRPGPRA